MRYLFSFVTPGLLLLAGCTTVQHHGPIGFWSRNRHHPTDSKPHGPWREYFDAHKHQRANAGRYRHGLPVGRWRYYAPSGELERTEQYARRTPGLLTIQYYYPNGHLAKQGQARYQLTEAAARFFWIGEWKCYSVTGQPQPSEFYRNGVRTATPLITPTGDSLAWPTR